MSAVPSYEDSPPSYSEITYVPLPEVNSAPTTPGQSADSATPSGPTAVGTVGGKQLLFIGVYNVVICRDLADRGRIGGSSELWRRKVGETSMFRCNDTCVVYSGGVVVARFQNNLFGLEPLTGEVRWSLNLEEYGVADMVAMVVEGGMVFVGLRDTLFAVAATIGEIMWKYCFDHKIRASVPTIVSCGLNVLGACCDDIVLFGAADGAIRWKSKFRGNTTFMSGAWDGGNCVMLGSTEQLFPCDLRDGSMMKTVTLVGTGLKSVCLTYDKNTRAFYVLCDNYVFAVSAGSHTILWKHDSCCMEKLTAISVEKNTGRVYCTSWSWLYCFNCMNAKQLKGASLLR